MTWLIRFLAGVGIVLALVIVFVLVIGNWGASGPPTQALSIAIGQRTVTVAGHYEDVTQESTADGIKVVVDGHEIAISPDQLTVDGEVQDLEPDQDVMVYVKESGEVVVTGAPQDEDEEAP